MAFASSQYGWSGNGYIGIGQDQIDNACSPASLSTNRPCIDSSTMNDAFPRLTIYANFIGITYNLNPRLILAMITMESSAADTCQGVNVISAPYLATWQDDCDCNCDDNCSECQSAMNAHYQDNPLMAIDHGIDFLFSDKYSTTAEDYTNILSAISAYNGAVCGMVNGQVTNYGASVAYYADICSTTDDDLPLGFVGYAGAGLS